MTPDGFTYWGHVADPKAAAATIDALQAKYEVWTRVDQKITFVYVKERAT